MSTRVAAAAGDEQETKRARTGATAMVRQRCWSSTFPDDLLIVIYALIASPRGRARFAAVCRSWQTAARGAPPVAALPWLLLSPHDEMIKHIHCPEDGTVVDLWRKPVGVGRWLVGGHDGGWLVSSVRGSLRIFNLFSCAEVMLVGKQTQVVCKDDRHGPNVITAWKIVFSEPPTSHNCILAAKTFDCGVALCRVGCADRGWTIQGCPRRELADITFCNGELYGLHYGRALSKFDIGFNKYGVPMITCERRLDVQWIDCSVIRGTSYIFDLQGKLAMAAIHNWLPNVNPFFKVFKLIDVCTGGSEPCGKHKWLEVTSLCEHALFLGEKISKVVYVPANMRGGVERNCIYYSHHCPLGPYGQMERNCIYYSHHCPLGPYDAVRSDKVFLTISNGNDNQTYYKVDDGKNDVAGGDLKRIRSVGYFEKGSAVGGMWIIPPHI